VNKDYQIIQQLRTIR